MIKAGSFFLNYKAEYDYLGLMKMSGCVSKVAKKRLRTLFVGKYSENVLKTIAEKIFTKNYFGFTCE